MIAQLERQPGLETRIAWYKLATCLKNKGNIDLRSLPGANLTSDSEQTKIVVTFVFESI